MLEKLHTYKIRVPASDVASFNRQWPCSELNTARSYWFEFDESNGDLIDTDVPEEDDGSAAAAMADDIKAYILDGDLPAWVRS